jgi:hypothetical protein
VIHACAVVRLCERFSCLPSQLREEGIEFLRMVDIEAQMTKATDTKR